MAKQSKLDLGMPEDEDPTDGPGDGAGLPGVMSGALQKESDIYSVTGITYRIKNILEYNDSLNDIWVRGEISNFTKHSSGHLYFTMKDEECALNCVKWRGSGKPIRFEPEQGLKVLAHGHIGVYTKQGNYQFIIDELKPDGLGELYLAYLQLKDKLENEGLFDEIHKKPLPAFPSIIGVATSPTGDAVRDIINGISRRFPQVTIYLAPTRVQGEGAAESIVKGLEILDAQPDVDMIIVGRGGGSAEDLWSFNEEAVVRAIFKCEHPVISAVGHQRDFPLSDFVADVRAETPSVAAVIAVPDRTELLTGIQGLQEQLLHEIMGRLQQNRHEFDQLVGSHALRRPFERVHEEQQNLDEIKLRLGSGMKSLMKIKKLEYKRGADMLESLDPSSVLNRGYSVALSTEVPGKIIDSISELETNENIDVILSDGEISCNIDSINMLSDPFKHILELRKKKKSK
jgi:exodeoxyribonuclease VII large subunit